MRWLSTILVLLFCNHYESHGIIQAHFSGIWCLYQHLEAIQSPPILTKAFRIYCIKCWMTAYTKHADIYTLQCRNWPLSLWCWGIRSLFSVVRLSSSAFQGKPSTSAKELYHTNTAVIIQTTVIYNRQQSFIWKLTKVHVFVSVCIWMFVCVCGCFWSTQWWSHWIFPSQRSQWLSWLMRMMTDDDDGSWFSISNPAPKLKPEAI